MNVARGRFADLSIEEKKVGALAENVLISPRVGDRTAVTTTPIWPLPVRASSLSYTVCLFQEVP